MFMELLSAMRATVRLSLHLLVLSSAGMTLFFAPPSLVIYEGDSAVFGCSPFDRHEPPILLRNSFIFSEADTRLHHHDFEDTSSTSRSNRTYHFTDVRWSDNNSIFRCVVGDVSSNEVRLTILVLPELSGPTGPKKVLENSPATTTYHYNDTRGQPPSHSFTWTKNGNPFHGNSRVSLQDSNTTMTVRNVLREDAGYYIITAVSGAGQTSVDLYLQVIYDEFTYAPRSKSVEVGDTIMLRCGHRFGLTYSWSTNRGSVHQLKTTVQLREDNRELLYGPVHNRDSLLEFTCVAHYSVGATGSFISPPALLIVLSVPRITAPAEVIAVEKMDSHIILPFSIVSFPPYQSTSYKHNGGPLDFTERDLSKFDNGSILIRSPGRKHAGDYSIQVLNARGGTSATIQLNIHYGPELRELEYTFVSQVDKTAHVPCAAEIESNPPPTFAWVGEEESISFRERYSVMEETGAMVLSDAHPEDSGVYFCIATNTVASATTSVHLLILEPPGPPGNIAVEQVGSTWVTMSWSPPVRREGDPIVSGYILSGSPQPTTYGSNGDELLSHQNAATTMENSACVEFNCSSTRLTVTGTNRANVTGLVPAVNYSMVVSALAHNVSLQSRPSSPEILFTTQLHVPGIGSVTAEVRGPGSAEVTWTLAYSGGIPVSEFSMQYKRNDSSKWNTARTKSWDEVLSGNSNFAISPRVRHVIVYGLEADESYLFRLAASNRMGMGRYVEVGEAIQSHQQGVPSSPSTPQIKGWGENKVIITTSIPKFGSKLNFSFSIIVLLNGLEEAEVMEIDVPEDYHEGDEILLTLTNISYRGGRTFQALATNYLGPSLPSEDSLEARQSIQEQSNLEGIASLALSSLMALVNTIATIIAISLCVVMGCESHKKKRSMVRRMEIVNDHPSGGDCPISPPPSLLFEDLGCSPDERIAHQVTNPPIDMATLDFSDLMSIHNHLSPNFIPTL